MGFRGGIKRDKYDATWSDLIRERNDWTCEKCGKVDPDGQARGKSRKMDCSHYYPRRHQSTRFCPRNCACLCKGCHQRFGEGGGDYTDWMLDKLGAEAIDDLRCKKNSIKKRAEAEKDKMRAHHQACIGYIRKRRFNGQQGYIDFPDYE